MKNEEYRTIEDIFLVLEKVTGKDDAIKAIEYRIQKFGDAYVRHVETAKGNAYNIQGFNIRASNEKVARKSIRKMLGENLLGPDTTVEMLEKVITKEQI